MDSIALFGIGGVAATIIISVGLLAFLITKINKS